MKNSKELTLNALEEAGHVKYRKISANNIRETRKIFAKRQRQNSQLFRKLPPSKRFVYFYIWYTYFRMLSWELFIEIANTLNDYSLLGSKNKNKKYINNKKRGAHRVLGGIIGLTISGIVAAIAGIASKAAVTVATTAAAVASSTTASTIASSIIGGAAGALAGAGTEAILDA